MENFKVKVKNEAESKEVQNLLVEFGFDKGPFTGLNYPRFVVTQGKKSTGVDFAYHDLDNLKEITIPELKDMVVLKRNDVGDATHTCDTTNSKYYVSSNSTVYFFNDEHANTWTLSMYKPYELKPIQNKEIDKPVVAKEYLVKDKQTGGYYQENNPASYDDAIEIPEGAEVASINYEGTINFYKKINGKYGLKNGIHYLTSNWYIPTKDYDPFDGKLEIVWKRNKQEAVEQFSPEDVVKTDLPEFKFIGFDAGDGADFGVDISGIDSKVKSLDKMCKGEINHRTAQAFNQIKGNKNLIDEDDVRLISELIELVKCHGASNETDMPF